MISAKNSPEQLVLGIQPCRHEHGELSVLAGQYAGEHLITIEARAILSGHNDPRREDRLAALERVRTTLSPSIARRQSLYKQPVGTFGVASASVPRLQ